MVSLFNKFTVNISRNSRCMLMKSKSYSILSQHKEFIDLVKNDGQGNILLEKTDGIAYLTISNSANRNAISRRMMFQLGEIIDNLFYHNSNNDMSKIYGLVISGTDNMFCSGADLRLAWNIINSPEKGVLMSRYMTEALSTIHNSSLVSVSVINGHAIGGGSELIAATDFRVILDNKYIQYIHKNIGAVPGWGGIHRLLQLVGRTKALHLLASADKITASYAKNIGLVDGIIDSTMSKDGKLEGRQFLSKYLESGFPGSVANMKNVIGETCSRILQESQEKEMLAFQKRWFCEDNKNSIHKFLKNNDTSKGGKIYRHSN